MLKGNYQYSTVVINFLVVLYSVEVFGQQLSERDSVKYENLKYKVTVAREKVEAIELKLQQADSLVEAGDLMIYEARKQFFEITPNRKQIEEEYKRNMKAVKKSMKSKDEDVSDKAEDDFKDLEDQYENDIKEYEYKVKQLNKQEVKGESVATRGMQRKMTTQPKLKVAVQKLEYARMNLEVFEESLSIQ